MEQQYIHDIFIGEFMSFIEARAVEKVEEGDVEQNLRKYFPDLNLDVRDPYLWDKVEQEISFIGNKILERARTISRGVITLWTIEKAKSIDKTGLFSSTNNNSIVIDATGLPIWEPKIPVTIVDKQIDSDYILDCTEEHILGILSVTTLSDRFDIYLEQVGDFHSEEGTSFDPMTIEDVAPNYVTNNRRFQATLSIGKVYFDTIDVIQGVKTICQWLHVDPHNYIRDIYKNGQKVTF